MKTIIIYASTHHDNTKKLVEHMAAGVSADTVNILNDPLPDLSSYRLIGLASGIYFGKFHDKITQFLAESKFASDQQVFLASTCGFACYDYTKSLKHMLNAKGIRCAGSFVCRGYNTNGLWRFVGGVARNHPNEQELASAQLFLKRIALP